GSLFDFSALRQGESLRRVWTDGPDITVLFAQAIFEQHRVLVEQLRLNFFQTQWHRLSQRGIAWTRLADFGLYSVILSCKCIQVLTDILRIFVGVFDAQQTHLL